MQCNVILFNSYYNFFSDVCPSGFELQYDDTCIECKKNYYRVKGQTTQCVACPGDFITLFAGSDSLEDCLCK